MPIFRTPLAGEMNDQANPEHLSPDEVIESINYELIGNNNRHKRRDPFEYGVKDSGVNDLNAILATIFTGTLLQISPVSYTHLTLPTILLV